MPGHGTAADVDTADVHLTDGFPGPFDRTISADDRAQIVEMTARFDLAVDTRHFEQLGPMFADDGVLDHQWGYRVGPADAEALVRENEPKEKQVRHQNTNHVLVRNDDGTVTMTSYLTAFLVADAPHGLAAPTIVAHGLNTHILRLEQGEWKIVRMTLDQTAVNDAVLTDRTAWVHDAATAAQRAAMDGRA